MNGGHFFSVSESKASNKGMETNKTYYFSDGYCIKITEMYIKIAFLVPNYYFATSDTCQTDTYW